MSERKVLNKYYPPDFDPSKIPRMKLAKNRQYTVRLMAPFNMRCATCGEYIYKGKKFNARKEDVENDTYLGIRIYRFYIKCTRCLQEISFKTDPKNTDYEIEAGATRNFMALKLAEEQARREQDELREEEANNPMKLLENRTEQSKNEIELLESLEELRDLNRRQQTVDYATMLQAYDTTETERERLERQEREDEDFIKSIDFKNKTLKTDTKKIVAEEIIEEIREDNILHKAGATISKSENTLMAPKLMSTSSSSLVNKTKQVTNNLNSQKSILKGLVKRKQPEVQVQNKQSRIDLDENLTKNEIKQQLEPVTIENSKVKSGLSLLTAYSDSDESE